MNRKQFTLVELIIAVVVISILLAIVLVNVGDWRKEATKSAILSNVRNIQTASDMYNLDGFKDTIGIEHPTWEKPSSVDFEKTKPKYLRAKPKQGKYWIDSNLVIWGATIDPPSVSKEGETYIISENKKASGVIVYKKAKKELKKVEELTSEEAVEFIGEEEQDYVFSFEDELGLETVPVGIGFENAEEENLSVGTCTLNGIYTAAKSSEFDWKTADRNVRYEAMTIDNDGNYVAIGWFGGRLEFPRSGYAIDKYNKDLKLIDTNVMERNAENSHIFNEYMYNNDIIQNNDGNYLVVNSKGITVYNEDLDYVKTIRITELTENMTLDRIIQDKQGDYFLAGWWNEDLGIAKLDSELKFIKHISFPSYELAEEMHEINLNDFILLSNGDLLLAGDELYLSGLSKNYYNGYDERGRIFRITNELNLVEEFNLGEDYERYNIKAVGELANNNIVAYTGSTTTDIITMRSFDPNLNQIAQKEYTHRSYDFYGTSRQYIYVDGNKFSTEIFNSMVTLDEGLNELSSEYTGYAPYGDGHVVGMKDGNSYISFITDGVYPHGLSKTQRFGDYWEDEIVEIREAVPRAIHTAPPYKENIVGFEFEGMPENSGDGSGVSHLPLSEEIYSSGYNGETHSVNPVYAGSVMGVLDMSTGNPEEMYIVNSDGTLRIMTPEDMQTLDPFTTPTFIMVNNKKDLYYMLGGGPLPEGAVLAAEEAGEPDEEPSEETAEVIRVDPCYAGSYMIYLGDMKLYLVQNDGVLKLLGNPYVKDPEDFGYDIWKNALFYLYPNGEIVDFPRINYPYTEL